MKEEYRCYMPLQDIVSENNFSICEPMSKHTSFKAGGAADCYITPNSAEKIVESIMFCRNMRIPYYIIGNGSNLLVSDKGYRGVMIQIGKQFSKIEMFASATYKEKGMAIKAQAGASMAEVAHFAYENALEGFAFAAGIPGTIGGGVTMNAGAYDGEMKQVVAEVEVMTPEGCILSLQKEELDLSYRHSCIPFKEYVVLSVTLELAKGKKEQIREHIKELKEKRISKQPLEFPSAGSTFKRPEGYFAGKLIGDAGLSGASKGGAQVSEKHNGFIINTGNATATDIYELIQEVRKKVHETSGVQLELEVQLLGTFS